MKTLKKSAAILISAIMLISSAFTAIVVYSESKFNQGDIITFGSYPQSKVTDTEITGALDRSVADSDFISYGYKDGDGTPGSEHESDQMKYADVVYNGEKYRGVRIFKYRPYTIYGTINSSNTNPQKRYELYEENGTTYWFRYEPIKWQMLDPDTGLVIGYNVLDAQPYYNNYITSETTDILYENSDIRTYVNTVFHDTAFGKEEDFITVNDERKDKLFLADSSIMTSYIYDSDIAYNDNLRCTPTTDYSYINGSSWYKTNNVYYNLYMLGDDCTNGLYIINPSGKFIRNNNGNDHYRALGYRVCMYLNLTKAANKNAIHYFSDGVEINTVYLAPGDSISQFEYKKTGYDFDGWDYSLPEKMPDHDIAVNAKWVAHRHSFILNSGNGKFNDESKVKTFTLDYGTDLSEYTETPTYQGYNFNGWDADIPEFMPDNNIEVTASWIEAEDTPYTIEIYKEKPIAESTEGNRIFEKETINKTGKTGSTVTVTPEILEYFDFDETSGNTSSTVMPDGSTTLKLYYLRKTGNVTFNIGEGYSAIKNEFKYGQVINYPPIPTVNGKAGKWDKTDNIFEGNTSSYNVVWTSESYSIAFDTDGGSNINNIVACYGESITRPSDPQKSGYTFIGWEPEIPETMPNSDITCKAKWELNKHKVSWIIDGETVKSESFDYGMEVTNPEADEKEGYTFSGWSFNGFVMPNNDVIVEGSYTLNTYTATFISEGKTEKYDFKFGEKIIAPDAGNKKNYLFKEWDKVIPDTMPSNDLTFTAIYEIKPYIRIKSYQNRTEKYKTTITFHADFAGYDESDIIWIDENGNTIGTGKDCTVNKAKNSYTVQAVIKNDTSESAKSEIENVKINKGFFDIIISFIVRLFSPQKYIKDQI